MRRGEAEAWFGNSQPWNLTTRESLALQTSYPFVYAGSNFIFCFFFSFYFYHPYVNDKRMYKYRTRDIWTNFPKVAGIRWLQNIFARRHQDALQGPWGGTFNWIFLFFYFRKLVGCMLKVCILLDKCTLVLTYTWDGEIDGCGGHVSHLKTIWHMVVSAFNPTFRPFFVAYLSSLSFSLFHSSPPFKPFKLAFIHREIYGMYHTALWMTPECPV